MAPDDSLSHSFFAIAIMIHMAIHDTASPIAILRRVCSLSEKSTIAAYITGYLPKLKVPWIRTAASGCCLIWLLSLEFCHPEFEPRRRHNMHALASLRLGDDQFNVKHVHIPGSCDVL